MVAHRLRGGLVRAAGRRGPGLARGRRRRCRLGRPGPLIRRPRDNRRGAGGTARNGRESMWHRLGAVAVVALLALLSACTRPQASGPAVAQPAATATTPAASPPAANATAATNPAPAQPSRPLPARFHATVSPLPAGLAAQMRGTTWHPGCPVPLRELRLLTVRYWGFDGQVHQGPIVVNQAEASQVVSVFGRLFRARFPIQQLHLAVQYRPDQDDPNDTRDYTSGFNCRPVVTARGPRTNWS